MAEMTPMMKQYLEMKERNPDSILFFRLGDFYEMFNEDARLVSKELDLTLTTRDRNKPPEERTPMCGVPYHSCDSYIARLIAKGYKVAICEQTEDPATAKGLVDRDIIRVITPGTVIASSMLEEGRNNFLCAVYADSTALGLCLCDISTGEVFATSFPSGEEALPHLENELGRFHPAEALLSDGAWNLEGLTGFLREKLGCLCENGGEGRFRYDVSRTQVEGQFRAGLDSLPEGDRAAVQATGGLLSYLYETQKTDLSHIAVFTYYTAGQFMELDLTARQTLELTETMRGKEKKGSLLWVLDKTRTAMGHRLIRGWLERPLLSPVQIARRQQAVNDLGTSSPGRSWPWSCGRSLTWSGSSAGWCTAPQAAGTWPPWGAAWAACPGCGSCWRAAPPPCSSPCGRSWTTCPSCGTCSSGPWWTSPPSPSGRESLSGRGTARRWTASATSSTTGRSCWPTWRAAPRSRRASRT